MTVGYLVLAEYWGDSGWTLDRSALVLFASREAATNQADYLKSVGGVDVLVEVVEMPIVTVV